jgi:hypothetical protein
MTRDTLADTLASLVIFGPSPKECHVLIEWPFSKEEYEGKLSHKRLRGVQIEGIGVRQSST